MKGIGTLIKLAKRRLDEQRRKVADLERLKDNLVSMGNELDREIAGERTAAAAAQEFASSFPAFMAAAIERRANLRRSLAEAEAAILVARDELAERFQEVKRYELAAEIRDKREREKADRRSQSVLDEIGLNLHRRRDAS